MTSATPMRCVTVDVVAPEAHEYENKHDAPSGTVTQHRSMYRCSQTNVKTPQYPNSALLTFTAAVSAAMCTPDAAIMKRVLASFLTLFNAGGSYIQQAAPASPNPGQTLHVTM